MLQIYQPDDLVLATVNASGSNPGTVPEFRVPLVDPRVRVVVSIIFRRTNGSQVNRPPGNNLAWLCVRCKDKQGNAYPVTNILGTGKGASVMGALTPATPTTNGLQGYSFEWQSLGDEIYGYVDVTTAAGSGEAGQWILATRAQAVEPMCADEWERLKREFAPQLIVGPTAILN